MDELEVRSPERDPRFPSGAWTGFFLQHWLPGRHTTDMHLTCSGGELRGQGKDWVGRYTIEGHYQLATGKCEWTKRYLGRHSVAYRGINDGHGIWGVWEIKQLGGLYTDRGGFHLWPEGTNVSEASDQTERAVLEVMRQEYGNRLPFSIWGVLLLMAAIALVVILMQWNWQF